MVGFGSSLRIAKRSGWERAYLDYETLKLLLSQIEAVYEEEGHRRNGTPRAGSGANRRRRKGGPGDYRDELFLESDSDLAFASSASDVFGVTSSSDEETGHVGEQGRAAPSATLGTASEAKPFTLTYSHEDVSSSEGYDEEEYDGLGECAGGTLTRAWRRADKNAVVEKKPKKKKRSREDGAAEFFMGGDFLDAEGNDGLAENEDLQAQPSYSSSLLNTSFQRGSFTTEQTALLQQSQSSTSQSASFYSFPTGTESSMTPPRDYFGGGSAAGATWSQLGTHVETFPKPTPNPPPPRPPQTKAEIRRNQREEERRRQRRQRRRRKIAKRRRLMEQRVPRHLRVAHGKARAITERFLGLLRAEVEKVTLFAQARLGELADTAGSLRFPSYDDSDYGGSFSDSFHLNRPSRPGASYEVLSDGGMHPSASSSDEEHMGGRRGIFPWSDTSSEEEMSEGGRNPLSPTYGKKLQKSISAGGVSVSTEHRTNISSHGKEKEKKDSSRRKVKGGKKREEKSNKALDAAQRQIAHFEELRQSRPVFQRNDHIVGEDLLLLSAVDETDGYTAVGVELMHVLRFICINVIAVRKICRKHDRLLANRMLGGYYHRKQRSLDEKGQKSKRDKRGNRHSDKEQNPVTLGGILATSVGDDAELATGERRERNKLVGVFDTKIQNLANSTTVQVIASCLTLALSESEVSRSRANALARLNSSSNMAETPLRRGNRNDERNEATVPFGLSPSRWIPKAYGYEAPMQRDETFEDTASSFASNSDDGGPPSTASSVSLTRLRFTVVSIFALREAARSKEDTYSSFLCRTSLVIPGPVGEGLDGCSRETLDFFVAYNPDTALLLHSSSLYKGLGEGKWRHCAITNLMLSALATAITASQPISSAEYVAQPDDTDLVMNALSITPDPEGLACLETVAMETAMGGSTSHSHDGGKGIDCRTLRLNCTSLLLYTMNYYIILPSANPFVKSTGAHASYSAALIGATSFSAIFSNMFHSFLLSKETEEKKHHSFGPSFFRFPLILSSFFPIIGNAVYVLAMYRSSIPMAVGGRLIIGLGSSEILHRLLVIAHYLPDVCIVAESARLVKAQVRGLTISLLVGALLQTFDVNMFVSGRHIYVPSVGLASGLMALLWFVQWVRLCFMFHEPRGNAHISDVDQQPEEPRNDSGDAFNDSSSDSDSSLDRISGTPESIFFRSSSEGSEGTRDELEAAYGSNPVLTALPARPKLNNTDDKESKHVSASEGHGKRRRKRGLKTFAGRLFHVLTFNVALPITFALVVLIKFAHEILFTSCALITRRYFGWSGGLAGLFLGSLSALVLPINYFCEKLSRTFEERTVVKRSLVIITVGLVILVNWGSLFYIFSRAKNLMTEEPWSEAVPPYDWIFGIYQYIIGFIITYVGVVALEATTLSLMSKVAPLKLRGSLINCGSIVTYLSLIGKVAGDVQILMVGLSHRLINTDIVNSLVIPLIVLCLVAGFIVKKHFFFLI